MFIHEGVLFISQQQSKEHISVTMTHSLQLKAGGTG